MTRVAVIGNAGGGKSTLSRKLGQALGLPVHSIDKIQWRPGWTPTPAEEVRSAHEAILASGRWIIDGWGGWDNMQARFEAADTIIFVDFPIAIHYWWAFKRQVKCLFLPNPDVPEGCNFLPKTWELTKLMWFIHRQFRPRLFALIDPFREQKQVIHLRSPGQLRRFLRQHCGSSTD